MNKKVLLVLTCVVLSVILILAIVKIKTSKEEIKQQEENENEVDIVEVIEEKKWEWEKDLPENHNINKETIEALHKEVDSHPINSSVIIKDGVIIDEYYKDGYDENSIFAVHSCSKSITSALIGIAIDKGYIESVDTPISNYFPQVLESDNEHLKEITIWHLLTHTTGLRANDDPNWNEWLGSENWVDYVLERPYRAKPGTVFSYFTGNTHLLSAILQQATGKTAYEFGKEYIFEPLDMDSIQCGVDPQGISDGGNGFTMNVYDMAKFGQLFLNEGVWNGEQIVPKQWVTDSTSIQVSRPSAYANYGYQWWVRTFGTQNYKAYFAQGHAGQYIIVVPDLKLITVLTSNYTGNKSLYWGYMDTLVNGCSEEV